MKLLALLVSFATAVTKIALVNHTDPSYTDACLETTGELCSYCCLVDLKWCS